MTTEERFDEPTYPLEEVKSRVENGSFTITRYAEKWAFNHEYDRSDIEECVLGLSKDDFEKTMKSKKREGLWQDVYRPDYLGGPMYLKVQVLPSGQVHVISFKYG